MKTKQSCILFLSIYLTLSIGYAHPTSSATTSSKAQQNPLDVRFVISEPCSLLGFLDTIAERPHCTKWVRQWYVNARQAKDNSGALINKDDEILKGYRQLLDQKEDVYAFKATGRELDLRQKLLVEAASCNTIDEFLKRSAEFMKAPDQDRLKRTLAYFTPIYSELVWEPSKPTLSKQLGAFQKGAEDSKFAERLSQVKQFLNADWPAGVPFTIVLTPLPKAKATGTHGESLGAVQVVELMHNYEFRDQADVVFHEAVHALWFSKKDEEAVRKLFTLPDRGAMPMTELYEGMATALGQGWFPKVAFGKPKKNWYADESISKYSHLVFPLYERYLDSGKPLDKDFAVAATKLYFEKMPNKDGYIAQTDSIIVLADEFQDLSDFKMRLGKIMPRLRESIISSPIDAKESLQEFNKHSIQRIVVLTSSANLKKLIPYGLTDSQLAMDEPAKNNPISVVADDRTFLIVVSSSAKDRESKLFALLQQKLWPKLK